MSHKNTTDAKTAPVLVGRRRGHYSLRVSAPNITSAEFCSRPPRATQRRVRPGRTNAARERSRVKTLRAAFLDVQRSLPSVPRDTKLAKLDILVLATTYIAQLTRTLQESSATKRDAIFVPANAERMAALWSAKGYLHPVKKWPMRVRLYAGMSACEKRDSSDVTLDHRGAAADYNGETT
ncbi:Transcription factor 24 [Lamellibrachia satsuma]|nr:Transcription factor 24 [Lamellibrachia satsuma]